MVDRDIILVFVLAIAIVSSIMALMHERHYQSRKERILEGRVKILEDIIGESRGV